MFKILVYMLVVGTILVSCKEKKMPSLSGDEPVDVEDFINAFKAVKPVYDFSDSILIRKDPDSSLISNIIFNQFIPDSILSKDFGKNIKPKIYMLRKVEAELQETYLFIKAVTSGKKIIYILCFDKEHRFAAAMPLLKEDGKASVTQVAGIDRRYTIFRTTYQKMPDGAMREGNEVYAFNAEVNQFVLIMTDAPDEKVDEVINPIDTLSRKHKYAADYVKDKMNIVSIRDGARSGKLNFFIHFDRTKGECTGELKGVASFIKPNVAEYRKAGDICILHFTFSASSVTIKEEGPCGTHRGVKCSFDGRYPRKKEVKKASKKK